MGARLQKRRQQCAPANARLAVRIRRRRGRAFAALAGARQAGEGKARAARCRLRGEAGAANQQATKLKQEDTTMPAYEYDTAEVVRFLDETWDRIDQLKLPKEKHDRAVTSAVVKRYPKMTTEQFCDALVIWGFNDAVLAWRAQMQIDKELFGF